MSDFHKDFLREPGQPPGPRVILGALGKHPGWDDHIDGLLDTETLALFKNSFYIQGIGRAIDSGAWDKPEMAGDLIDFDHYLMWVRGDQFLLGRLWASSDGRGRTKYPMILCAQCSGLPLDWALQRILPKLDQMREACRNVRTAREVRQIIQKAQADLQGMVATAPIRSEANTSLDRAAFLAGPELGPEHLGLMRILHELESNFSAYRKVKFGKTVGADVRAQHIRVPRNAASPAESLLAWREFFNLLFPRDLALLFVASAGKPWLDIFAGEPSANEIIPLRVQSAGLASSVPYQIGPDIKAACAELARQFETGQAAQSGQPRISKSAENKQIAPAETWDTPPPSKGLNLKWLGGAGGGLILVLLVFFLWPKHGKEQTVIPPMAAKSPASQPVKPKESMADDKAKAAAEAKAKADQERLAAEDKAKAAAEAKAAEEARVKADQERLAAEAKAKADQERLATEDKAKAVAEAKAAEEARMKADQERLVAEAEAKANQERLAADAKAKAAAEAKAAEEARVKADQERLAAEAKAKAEAEANKGNGGNSTTNLTATVPEAPSIPPVTPVVTPSTGPFKNSLGMEFVWVANLPGTEKASWDAGHQQGGWVARNLVTQTDFSTVMHTNPSVYKEGGALCPVESMTADDVDEFCHKLAAQNQSDRPLPAGWSYQLLTVEQWKFCANSTRDVDCILSYQTSKRQHPEPVGTLGTNSLGLFDTIGNVYEVTLGSNNVKVMAGANFSQPKTVAQALRTVLTTPYGPNRWTGFRIAITPAVQTP
jgi:hypothetical protein